MRKIQTTARKKNFIKKESIETLILLTINWKLLYQHNVWKQLLNDTTHWIILAANKEQEFVPYVSNWHTLSSNNIAILFYFSVKIIPLSIRDRHSVILGLLKTQTFKKQPPEMFYKDACFCKFRNIFRRTHVWKSWF